MQLKLPSGRRSTVAFFIFVRWMSCARAGGLSEQRGDRAPLAHRNREVAVEAETRLAYFLREDTPCSKSALPCRKNALTRDYIV